MYTWEWNRDTEIWNNDEYDTLEECIKAAKEEAKLDKHKTVVYIGECVPYAPKADCTDVLDRMQEQAEETCGEAGEDWEAYDWHKKDELEELDRTITTAACDWMKAYGYYPACYSIQNIKAYLLDDGI